MSQTIPTLDLPFYTLTTRLDDSDYRLEFTYSPRAERYYLNIYDVEDVLLAAGLKLVSNVFLLRYYHYRPGMPQGELMVTATTADTSSPKLGELGKGLRCELTYFPAAEIAAQRARVGV